MRTHSLAVTLLSSALALPAQTATPVAAPHLLIDTVGPDGWRSRLGPTNLGSLLASEQGQGLWQPQVLPLLGYWRQMFGTEAEYETARGRLLGYRGRVQLAVWFDGSDGPFDRQGVLSMALVLDGDGSTDLTALAADLTAVQRQVMVGDWGERDLGGIKVALVSQGSDSVTAPFAIGSSVLVCAGSDERMAATVAAARALAGPAKAPAPATPALRLSIDLPAIVKMAAAAEPGNDWQDLRSLGFDSLGVLQMSVATAGPHVLAELAQAFTSDERGIFAALCPAATAVPELRRLTGARGSWRVGHFDLRAFYRSLLPVVASWMGNSTAEVEAEMKRETGIDLDTDLLAHMTTSVALAIEPITQLEEPDDASWTLVWQLADEKAFARGLDTLIASSKPMLSREATETEDGVALHRYGNMFGYDLWLAVGHGHWVIAGGSDAEALLRKALQQCKPGGGAAAAATPSEANEFAPLQRFLPANVHGLGRAELDAFVALPMEMWWFFLGQLSPLPIDSPGEDSEETRGARRELLRSHGLGTVRTATGYAERTWRWRVFW
jgi:hypothetical protein